MNSLLSRMLASSSSSSSSSNSNGNSNSSNHLLVTNNSQSNPLIINVDQLTTIHNDSQQRSANLNEIERDSPTPSSLLSSTRRNLFGIRLNHDQLKQDLKEMWKDQIERQKREWNFDFENLKPLTSSNSVSNGNIRNNGESFNNLKWIKVNTKPSLNPSTCSDLVMTNFERNELLKQNENDGYETDNDEIDEVNEEDVEEEEEEDDDALAIPTFYKYQRTKKMNQEQNRLKLIAAFNQITSSPSSRTTRIIQNQLNLNFNSPKPKFQLNQSTNKATFELNFKSPKHSTPLAAKSASKPSQTKTKSNKTNRKVTCQLGASNLNQNLILTFSQNRKDTLRSATTNSTNSTTKQTGDTNTVKVNTRKNSNITEKPTSTRQAKSTMASTKSKKSTSGKKQTSESLKQQQQLNQQQPLISNILQQRKRKLSSTTIQTISSSTQQKC